MIISSSPSSDYYYYGKSLASFKITKSIIKHKNFQEGSFEQQKSVSSQVIDRKNVGRSWQKRC